MVVYEDNDDQGTSPRVSNHSRVCFPLTFVEDLENLDPTSACQSIQKFLLGNNSIELFKIHGVYKFQGKTSNTETCPVILAHT